jgi:hypothetical protein
VLYVPTVSNVIAQVAFELLCGSLLFGVSSHPSLAPHLQNTVTVTKAALFIALFPSSCVKEATLPIMMELVEKGSLEKSGRMKTLN